MESAGRENWHEGEGIAFPAEHKQANLSSAHFAITDIFTPGEVFDIQNAAI